MTTAIKHGTQLIQQSMKLILKYKQLFLLPVIANIIIVFLLVGVLNPILRYEKLIIAKSAQTNVVVWLYVIVLLFLFLVHQITFYFNSALTQCVNDHFRGINISLKRGIKTANARLLKFYLWNNFSALIAPFIVLFSSLLKNIKLYQQIFLGLPWRIATQLIIPVIVIDNTWPLNSIKRSAELVRKTWGTNLKVNFGFIPLMLLARFFSMLPLLVSLFIGGRRTIIIGAALTFLIVLVIAIIMSAAQTTLSCVLHLYASEGIIAPGFHEKLIKKAYIKREPP